MKWWWNMALAVFFTACQPGLENKMERIEESGVSIELAQFRKESYVDVRYKLSFVIPEERSEAITGVVEILWKQGKKEPLVLDFKADSSQVVSLTVNDKPVAYRVEKEHIIVPASATWAGLNKVSIVFKAGDASLNRREDFLYTLFVPDRARTVFPCFDQPDLKAHYTLELDVPETWKAVANGAISSEDSLSHPGRKIVTFRETEPLPTYLFSFVAGKMKREIYSQGSRSISIYHRETEPARVAQCPEIAHQVLDALAWMEEYTGIPYPFAKYDLIIVPGFQFGGMEHTGATLYNDGSMFLNENPTLDEQLRRSSLIAHETAHMWFGDYVTMAWFDDVWTKEVFANYFAAKMVEPMFPSINHRLYFVRGYVPAAYAEDRTAGATPIKQSLDNLRNAGLVYSNIVYDKSPVMMEMLVRRMGEQAYRKGLHDDLHTFRYGNATWEELIKVFSKHTDVELKRWSQMWVHEPGMPTLDASVQGDSLVVTETDPHGKGRVWPQRIAYRVSSPAGTEAVEIELDGAKEGTAQAPLRLRHTAPVAVLPNTDGYAYGFFRLSEADQKAAFACLDTTRDALLKGSLLISLYENFQQKTIPAEAYLRALLHYIEREQDDLLYAMALGYIGSAADRLPLGTPWLEEALWQQVEAGATPSFRTQAFRRYLALAASPAASERLYQIWKTRQAPSGCSLSERDYIQLSYQLAIRMPERAEAIVREQAVRITNPDRQAEYRFISPAVSPLKHVRDSVFQSLLLAENRRVEPWASTSLALLNHPLREPESVEYIRPALEALQEVQRTGDIFFPTAWLRALLGGHASAAARDEVQRFREAHPDFPPLLNAKLLQQSDHLYRWQAE